MDKFDIHQLKEFQGSIIIATMFFNFQKNLKSKLEDLVKLIDI